MFCALCRSEKKKLRKDDNFSGPLGHRACTHFTVLNCQILWFVAKCAIQNMRVSLCVCCRSVHFPAQWSRGKNGRVCLCLYLCLCLCLRLGTRRFLHDARKTIATSSGATARWDSYASSIGIVCTPALHVKLGLRVQFLWRHVCQLTWLVCVRQVLFRSVRVYRHATLKKIIFLEECFAHSAARKKKN